MSDSTVFNNGVHIDPSEPAGRQILLARSIYINN